MQLRQMECFVERYRRLAATHGTTICDVRAMEAVEALMYLRRGRARTRARVRRLNPFISYATLDRWRARRLEIAAQDANRPGGAA